MFFGGLAGGDHQRDVQILCAREVIFLCILASRFAIRLVGVSFFLLLFFHGMISLSLSAVLENLGSGIVIGYRFHVSFVKTAREASFKESVWDLAFL